MSTRFQIGDHVLHEGPPLAAALATARADKVRPRCLCVDGGVEMYISRVDGRHIVKRMPGTGPDHSPRCESFEPSAELSGLGEVVGGAIQELPNEGLTALKFDFALTKLPGRVAPVPSAGEKPSSVKTDGKKLTLRGTLHYLWSEAGFNQWAPRMTGKRSWFVIRKYLLAAAQDKVSKGTGLSDLLFVPETFRSESKDEITQRRIAHLRRATSQHHGSRELMIVVGDIKELAPSRYAHKIVFKHLPDFHFMLNEDLFSRLQRHFSADLALWDALETSHLIGIATFSIGHTGLASVEEIAVMLANENWIPFETMYEKELIDAMTLQGRSFFKGLRYNMVNERPLCALCATDTHPRETAMFIDEGTGSDDHQAALSKLMEGSKLPTWVWNVTSSGMPPLPARQQSPDETGSAAVGVASAS